MDFIKEFFDKLRDIQALVAWAGYVGLFAIVVLLAVAAVGNWLGTVLQDGAGGDRVDAEPADLLAVHAHRALAVHRDRAARDRIARPRPAGDEAGIQQELVEASARYEFVKALQTPTHHGG